MFASLQIALLLLVFSSVGLSSDAVESRIAGLDAGIEMNVSDVYGEARQCGDGVASEAEQPRRSEALRAPIGRSSERYDRGEVLLSVSGTTRDDYLYTGDEARQRGDGVASEAKQPRRGEGSRAPAGRLSEQQYDEDLGMYFLRARYLNTSTGRFHGMDAYEGRNGEPLTLHKYLYAHANPVMNVDPSGYAALLTELQIVQSIQATLRNSGAVSLRVAVRRSGCYAFEYGIEKGVEQGLYLFLDSVGAYAGRSVDIERRLDRHGKRIIRRLGKITAAVGVSPKQLRELEQYLIDRMRDSLGAGPEDIRGRGGVSNKRNELNKKAREFLRKTIKICK